jgi:hypothetical protein
VAPVSLGWIRAAEIGLTFRRVTDADLPVLARIYASTRAEELAPVPWSDADKAAFLDMQFRAQHAHYQQHYPEADWLMTMRGEENIGRPRSPAEPASHHRYRLPAGISRSRPRRGTAARPPG